MFSGAPELVNLGGVCVCLFSPARYWHSNGLNYQHQPLYIVGVHFRLVPCELKDFIFLNSYQITTEVALVLLSSATILLIVPFKYILAFLLFDLFTRELEFRREMVTRFITILKERWDTIPAAPVIVLPFESEESKATDERGETAEQAIKKKLDQWQE